MGVQISDLDTRVFITDIMYSLNQLHGGALELCYCSWLPVPGDDICPCLSGHPDITV